MAEVEVMTPRNQPQTRPEFNVSCPKNSTKQRSNPNLKRTPAIPEGRRATRPTKRKAN